MADADATRIVRCPACATANRVPADRVGVGGKCGRCGAALFRGEPVVLTAANFDAHAARSDLPLLVDFWATWCGPCRQMAPAFAAAAAALEPAMRLGKLDTEAEQAIAARYAVRSIPTLILFSGGRERARQAGAMPTAAIVAWARRALDAQMSDPDGLRLGPIGWMPDNPARPVLRPLEEVPGPAGKIVSLAGSVRIG